MRCPKCSLILAEYYALCPDCQSDLKEVRHLLGPFYEPHPELYQDLFEIEQDEEPTQEVFYPTEKLLEEETSSPFNPAERENLPSPFDDHSEEDELHLEDEIPFLDEDLDDSEGPLGPESGPKKRNNPGEQEDEFFELRGLEDLDDLEDLLPEDFTEGKST